MVIWLFRVLFFLAGCGVAYSISTGEGVQNPYMMFLLGILISSGIVVLEWLLSSSPIAAISSVIFGTLVGMLFAVLAVRVLLLVTGQVYADPVLQAQFERDISLVFMAVFIYLAIAFLYQTRDKFRVVIPYVEFRREEKGARPVLLDTSVIVDGRVSEILATDIIDGPIIVPQMVLQELHKIADADDKLRRQRGRLGMRMLDEIRGNPDLDVRIQALDSDPNKPVDERLVETAKKHNARIMTNDYNLNRLASLEGIDIINLNELANALKPVALPDEEIEVKLLRPGEQPGQAVGHLEDGTMVVVEEASEMINQVVRIVVTNTITRDTGRMIFGRLVQSGGSGASARNRKRRS